MRHESLKRVAAAILLALVAGCTAQVGRADLPPVPSLDAAQRYLRGVVARAIDGDLVHFCDGEQGVCRQNLARSDPATAPDGAPLVVGTREILPRDLGGGMSELGGRVLELCGRDGLGMPYYSEMLVFEAEGRVTTNNPVFWTGILVGEGNVTTTRPPTPTGCPT